MPDSERVLHKAAAYGRCSPRELYQSLASLQPVHAALAGLPATPQPQPPPGEGA